MNIDVKITKANGTFTASVLGDPSIRVEAPNPSVAIQQLRIILERMVHDGELTSIEVSGNGIADFVGILKDDPTLEEMVAEIYRQRDLEPYP